ncbi:hypothetical protein CYLTODRAFT_488038 [Cylindrobasidium torrendii FP15055 ss-10]|uniref:Uncharacterized protein n=1 Tax=Cylindrobasidium torrendii FP15055 ss-10 TaxID=1314674 RepID=A0A0D7BLL4_9AGAR|nr:hypothetical protein CYLTODRAFT_488038 [Cylindrobasidium torrendii FP15055 ss-10]
MQTLHRSQDISTCPIFYSDTVLHTLLPREYSTLYRVEYMLGLGSKNLRENIYCTDNAIEVQPRMLSCLGHGAAWFIPQEHICEKILQVARHNMSCPANERFLFCEVPDSNSNSCVYTLDLSKIRKTLYTRHPVTGHVTAHIAPYPNMPSFSLSASPWIAAIAAQNAFLRDLSHPISRINDTLYDTYPPDHFGVGVSPSTVLEVPLPAYGPSIELSPPPVCEILPSKPKDSKRLRRCPPSDESSRSSDDEPRPPKRICRTKKTREPRLDPRSAAKAICPTSHAPRTRAERRRAGH